MPADIQQQGILVLQYLEKFPNASSNSLAKMLYENHRLVFNSQETARGRVRHYRGTHGATALKYLKDKRFIGTGITLLPEGKSDVYEPYCLPTANNNILFVSDIHFPFHDLEALHTAMQYAKDHAVNTVVLGGDIVDMYDQSSFDRVPQLSTFREERELYWRFVDELNAMIPGVKIFYIEGNHEYRLKRYLLRKAPEIFGMEEFELPVLFQMERDGVTYIDRRRYIKAGDLNIMHGHEFGSGFSSPVNPARSMYLRAKTNVVFGHNHQISQHSEPNLHSEVMSCASVGCLCGLHPEYRPLNKWSHGFAHININADKTFRLKNKTIINNKVL